MPRIFYTERDIEDLVKRGVKEVEVNDDVYITDVAREKMEQLGLKAKAVSSKSPAGSLPGVQLSASTGALSEAEKQQVIEKVKGGVLAKLGPGVDTSLVDTIVRRVVSQL